MSPLLLCALLGAGSVAALGLNMPQAVSQLLSRRRSRRALGPPSGLALTAPPADHAASELENLGEALQRAASMPAPRLVACRTICAHVARLPFPAALLDREGRIVATNEALVGIFGAPGSADLLGQSTLAPEDSARKRLQRDGRAVVHRRFLAPWSSRLQLRLRYVAMPGDPTLPPLLLTVEDRAARKRGQGAGRGDGEASVAAYGRIASELLDAFFVRLRMAHGGGNAAAREAIREAAALVLDLAAQLRTIDEGFRHHGEAVDVARVLRKAVRLLRHVANGSVRMRIEPSAPPVRISGCSGRLYEALLDLGLNARDAMHQDGDLALGLDVRWAADPDACFPGVPPRFAVLSVEDDGPGLPEPVLRDLLGASLESPAQGSVQHPGLLRVHRCVESYNGWIELDTAPGHGTKFQILLPLS